MRLCIPALFVLTAAAGLPPAVRPRRRQRRRPGPRACSSTSSSPLTPGEGKFPASFLMGSADDAAPASEKPAVKVTLKASPSPSRSTR